jgi:hypothetical protein
MNTGPLGDRDTCPDIIAPSTSHNRYNTGTTMPYFIYKITPGDTPNARTLDLVSEHDGYRDAKQEVKALRVAQDADVNYSYKIMFAGSQGEAEQQLLEVREQPIVKEWEK